MDCLMAAFPKLVYRCNAIPIKISAGIFAEINKLMIKFIWKCKGPTIAKTILKKVERLKLNQFQNLLQSYSDQNSAVLV